MMTLHLKADSEDQMKAELFGLLVDQEGRFIVAAEGFTMPGDQGGWIEEGFALDIIGQLMLEPGFLEDDGKMSKQPRFAEGFHANLLCGEQLAALIPDEIKIEVNQPKRVFANG